MSATKTQQEKPQSIKAWVAEMLDGYDYETAIIKDSFRQSLEQEASKANLNLNSASEQMFRVSPEALNNIQARQLLSLLCEVQRQNAKPVHAHRCVECGGSVPCFEPEGCTETEDECRACHEGMRPSEYNAYHRRLAEKGWL
jgi:hypothetical protein